MVLIPLWTRTPLHCFLNLLLEFTRTTYPGNLYPISLPESRPDTLLDPHPNALSEPYPIASMFIQPYMLIPGQITLPDSSLNQTSIYPALHSLTRPNYLTRSFPGRTSAYPILPGHLTRLPYPVELPFDPHFVKSSSTVQHFVV
jgi:hypothetical protein